MTNKTNKTISEERVEQINESSFPVAPTGITQVSREGRRKSFLSFLPSHKRIQHPLRQSKSGSNGKKKLEPNVDMDIWERIILEENFRGLSLQTLKEEVSIPFPLLETLPHKILLLSPAVSIEEVKMDEGSDLLNRVKNLLDSKSQMESELRVKCNRLEKLEIQLADYQKKMEELQSKRESKTFEFETMIINLQRRLECTQEDFAFSQREFDESNHSLSDCKKKLEETNAFQQELQAKLSECNSEIETMKGKMKKDGESINRLRTKNSRLRKALDAISDSLLCIICSEKICDSIFWPCKHQTVCEDCAKKTDLKECCLCRSPIVYSLKVYPNFSEHNPTLKEVGSS